MTLQRLTLAYLIAFILVQALFAAFPGIDLAVSAVFADGPQGFAWADGMVPALNLVVRRLGELAVFLLLVGLIYGVMSSKVHGRDLRLLAYPFLCVTLASGAVVNLLLKSHIGRARPDTVAEFGGTAQFTPPWQVAGECARNCSFASGEVALAASLAIPVVVILWPHLGRPRGRVLAVLVAAVYVGLTAVLRIGLGRHFLSDAVFAILLAAGAALLLYPLLRVDRARATLRLLARPGPAVKLAEQRGIF